MEHTNLGENKISTTSIARNDTSYEREKNYEKGSMKI